MEIRGSSLDLADLFSFSSRDHDTTKGEAVVAAQQGRQLDGRACMYLMSKSKTHRNHHRDVQGAVRSRYCTRPHGAESG
jgi:hypothetical protein